MRIWWKCNAKWEYEWEREKKRKLISVRSFWFTPDFDKHILLHTVFLGIHVERENGVYCGFCAIFAWKAVGINARVEKASLIWISFGFRLHFLCFRLFVGLIIAFRIHIYHIRKKHEFLLLKTAVHQAKHSKKHLFQITLSFVYISDT